MCWYSDIGNKCIAVPFSLGPDRRIRLQEFSLFNVEDDMRGNGLNIYFPKHGCLQYVFCTIYNGKF